MKIKMYLAVLSLLFLVGCSGDVPDEMRAVMLGTEDVPSNWIIFNQSTGEEAGGQMYNIAFAYGNESTAPAVEQQVIVYADEASAAKGYEEYKVYMFVEGWSVPPEAAFTPASAGDPFQFMCTDRELDHVMMKNCFILQQHGKYVSAVGIQMGDPLTFDVVNGILKAVDAKLNQ